MRSTQVRVLAGLLSIPVSAPAAAYDWTVEAYVNVIEISYLPERVVFTVNADAGSCAAGGWLAWISKGVSDVEKSASSEAVLAGLMTARATNRPVRIYGTNANCTVQFIHLL